jgi:hypothetical protein
LCGKLAARLINKKVISMFSMNMKCYAKPRPTVPREGYKAKLIGVVPSEPYTWKDYCHGLSEANLPRYTTKALVRLETFSKGRVFEIPWSGIEIVDKWYDEVEEVSYEEHLEALRGS